MKATPIDVDLAATGYLKTPDGRLRYVWYADRIIGRMTQLGARLYWSPLEPWAVTFIWRQAVMLDPELIEQPPWRIRKVLAEELAHLQIGRSEELARNLGLVQWGSLVEPLTF